MALALGCGSDLLTAPACCKATGQVGIQDQDRGGGSVLRRGSPQQAQGPLQNFGPKIQGALGCFIQSQVLPDYAVNPVPRQQRRLPGKGPERPNAAHGSHLALFSLFCLQLSYAVATAPSPYSRAHLLWGKI